MWQAFRKVVACDRSCAGVGPHCGDDILVAFDYEKSVDALRPTAFPRAVQIPEHLMAIWHPLRRGCRASFGPFSFNHDDCVFGLQIHIRVCEPLKNVPTLGLLRLAVD